MPRHIKIFSHDSQITAEIIKLLNEASLGACDDLEIETIETKGEINSYCIKRTPCIMFGSLVIHEGSVPTRQQILGWFV